MSSYDIYRRRKPSYKPVAGDRDIFKKRLVQVAGLKAYRSWLHENTLSTGYAVSALVVFWAFLNMLFLTLLSYNGTTGMIQGALALNIMLAAIASMLSVSVVSEWRVSQKYLPPPSKFLDTVLKSYANMDRVLLGEDPVPDDLVAAIKEHANVQYTPSAARNMVWGAASDNASSLANIDAGTIDADVVKVLALGPDALNDSDCFRLVYPFAQGLPELSSKALYKTAWDAYFNKKWSLASAQPVNDMLSWAVACEVVLDADFIRDLAKQSTSTPSVVYPKKTHKHKILRTLGAPYYRKLWGDTVIQRQQIQYQQIQQARIEQLLKTAQTSVVNEMDLHLVEEVFPSSKKNSA